MKKNALKTPDGFRDYLFEEIAAQNKIENILTNVFEQKGYEEVSTPTLEFLDLFDESTSIVPVESMYKLVDGKGRILVMRSDITASIARMTATRLRDADFPLRLFYNEKVFRINRSGGGLRDEISQSGVELIGAGGMEADLEIMLLAIEALKKTSDDFVFEINNIGIYKKLASKFKKLKLNSFCGGIEILDEALSKYNDICEDEINYLMNIYKELEKLSPSGTKILVDLTYGGKNPAYYTGVLFRAYIAGSGITVLSGGRYDTLLSHFGMDKPGAGFAFENDALADALLKLREEV